MTVIKPEPVMKPIWEFLGLALFLAPFGLVLSLLTVPLVGGVNTQPVDQFLLAFFLVMAGACMSFKARTSADPSRWKPARVSLFWRSVIVVIAFFTLVLWVLIWSGAISALFPVAERSLASKPVAWRIGPLTCSLFNLKQASAWSSLVVMGVLGERNLKRGSVERKVLAGYVLLGVLFMFKSARARLSSLSSGLGFLVCLSMLAGTTFILWDENEHGGKLRSFFLGMTCLLALLCTAFAPGTSRAISSIISFMLSVAMSTFNLLLIPIGYLAGFLITLIKRLINYNADAARMPFQPGSNQDLLEKAQQVFKTPLAMKIMGWLSVCVILFILALFFSRYLKSQTNQNNQKPDEIREREWSSQEAWEWTVQASKKILSAVLPRKLLQKQKSRTVIQEIYREFLEVCQKAGYIRMPHETPLEFAETLASSIPEVELPAQIISQSFSQYFYSGSNPDDAQIRDLRKTLTDFSTLIKPAHK